MPIVLLAFGLLVMYVVVSQKKSSNAGSTGDGRIKPPGTGGSGQGLTNAINDVTAGITIGSGLGNLINAGLGNSGNPALTTIATVGGALVGVGVALAVLGLIAPWVVAIVIGVVVVAYIVGALIQDSARIQYGQHGAMGDLDTHWSQLHAQVFSAVRARPEVTSWSDVRVERLCIPFCDGYMRRLNKNAYDKWMAQPHGFGMDDHGHASWGMDRGYFVGGVNGDGSLYDTYQWHSENPAFASTYCPVEEQTSVVRRIPLPIRVGGISVSGR